MKYVRNFTDIDDKIIDRAVETKRRAQDISEEQMKALKDINLEDPRKYAFEAGLLEGRTDLKDEIIAEEAEALRSQS